MSDDNEAYDALQKFICVRWGFCGCLKNDKPINIDDIIPDSGLVSADQFVDWVFLANNMNPNSNPKKWERHKAAIRAEFIKLMGDEVVDVSKLKHY